MNILYKVFASDYFSAMKIFSKSKGCEIDTWTYAGEDAEDNAHKNNGIPYLPFTLDGLDAEYRITCIDKNLYGIFISGS